MHKSTVMFLPHSPEFSFPTCFFPFADKIQDTPVSSELKIRDGGKEWISVSSSNLSTKQPVAR
jgi:hypothetical protein